jgi:hypothetical protein
VLHPYKLATIAVLTREMIESSNAEALIGDALARSCGLALDAALFDSNAATSARPAGLRFGVAALTPSANTDAFGAAYEDIVTVVNAVAPVAGRGPIAVVGSAGRMMTLRARFQDFEDLIPVPVPGVGNDLIAVAVQAVAAALSPNPEVETSNASSLHMSDAPVPLGSAAVPTRSLFQTNSIATKVRWPVSWTVRDPRAVAWLTPVWK